jgi:predicted ATPase
MADLSPEIQKIENKLISDPASWPKLIEQLQIDGIHGFNSQIIKFIFPISVVVGENGTGKSTILKIAACVYKSNYFPSDVFPKTLWDNPHNIEIKYQVKQGTAIKNRSIKKTLERWSDLTGRPENNVIYFDINRIKAIESVIGYSKLTRKYVSEVSSQDISEDSRNDISEIMNRDYERIRNAKTNADTNKSIFVAKLSFGEVSQFHLGSGESITTEMMTTLASLPKYSLIIIDEIESSLHPRAQRRLIRKLIELTRIKEFQIILSTHSPYILEELPAKSRILLLQSSTGTRIMYGTSTEFCMSQIDEKLHYEALLAVEDRRAKVATIEIIRSVNPDMLQRMGIVAVGTATNVSALAKLSKDGEFPTKVVGILDADQDLQTLINCTKIIGTSAPEKDIFASIKEIQLSNLAERLGVNTELLGRELDTVMTIQDHHVWCSSLATRLSLSEDKLWSDMVFVWITKIIPQKTKQDFVNSIEQILASMTA